MCNTNIIINLKKHIRLIFFSFFFFYKSQMLIITQNTETKLSYSKGSHIKICKKIKKKKKRMKLRNLIGYRRKNRRRRRRGSGGSSGRPIGANSDPRGGSDSYPPCLASPSSFDSFNFFILYIHTIEPCLLL